MLHYFQTVAIFYTLTIFVTHSRTQIYTNFSLIFCKPFAYIILKNKKKTELQANFSKSLEKYIVFGSR